MLAMAGIAAHISYWHAYVVVRQYGESGVTALLELGTIDGLVHASTMVILHAVRHQLPVPRLARWMLALGITASLAVNVAQSLGVAAVVVPALALEYSPRLLQPEHNCSSSRHERRRPGRGAPREIRLIASNPVCRRKPLRLAATVRVVQIRMICMPVSLVDRRTDAA